MAHLDDDLQAYLNSPEIKRTREDPCEYKTVIWSGSNVIKEMNSVGWLLVSAVILLFVLSLPWGLLF